MGIVESRNIDILFLDEPIVGCDDTSHWCKENGVAAHEGEECRSGTEDFPGNDNPSTYNSSDDTAAPDIDVFGEQNSQIVGSGDGIGGDICTNLGNIPTETSEERGSPSTRVIEPFCADVEGIPNVLSIDHERGTGGDDTQNTANSEDDGQEW